METESKPQPLHLEDFHEGQRFSSARREITAEEIKAFAAQFDPQPFHLDEASAQDTFFSGLAASGWHTAALTMRLLVDGAMPVAGGIIGTGGEIRWPRATRPGDMLRVEVVVEKVTASRSRPDRGTVTVRCETLNQRDEPVQTMVTTVVAFRRR